MHKLSADTIQEALRELQFNWQLDGDALDFDLETKDFSQALWVVTEVGQQAEELGHHPDITIHDYNHVRFRLSTHSVGGVTRKDLELAGAIEGVATRIE